MTMTTIKVPTELRDRISEGARKRGVTTAALLTQLLDEHERTQWFAAIKQAYQQLPVDDDYWSETHAWDELASSVSVEDE